jgi:N-acetyl-gamma-glutamyl-phosphate reductase
MANKQNYTVAVAGASGYAGGELLRLLAGHPYLDVITAAAGTKAGQSVTAIHPQLVDYAEMELVETDAAVLAQADVVFLALPHGQSAALAAGIPPHVVVVDLGADHRLADAAAWEKYYGLPHAGNWLYGMPELPGARESLVGAVRIANPGCYPTAVSLSLAPILAASLADASDVNVVAASGTSGAGRKASEALLGAEVMGAMRAYKVGGAHQHTPEMEQALSQASSKNVRVSFTPLLAPMPRGILATSSARLAAGADEVGLRECLEVAYADEPFVHVLPAGQWPTTASVAGSNSVHLQVAADEHAGRVVVVAAMDNLVKGAAGQAVQNANLALEFDETEGLPAMGVAP